VHSRAEWGIAAAVVGLVRATRCDGQVVTTVGWLSSRFFFEGTGVMDVEKNSYLEVKASYQ